MNNWTSYATLLEIIEEFASNEGWIASEEELSERFDEEIAPGVLEEYGEEDHTAHVLAFNDWSDSLCKDGEIHPEQYRQYCYVGKYS